MKNEKHSDFQADKVQDKAYIEKCAAEGAMKASYIANKTLSKVMKKVGFWQIKK